MKKIIMLLALFSIAVSAQQKGSFTDPRNGKTYKTVKIGNQTWMAENMNYAAGRSVCYENDERICQICGRLYDWVTATAICPSGWHLPNKQELDKLAPSFGIADHSIVNCGNRHYSKGFGLYGEYAVFWSATSATDQDWNYYEKNYDKFAWYWWVNSSDAYVTTDILFKGYMNSVRCLKD
jgi:hypothetical protein